ncbi:Replicase polyprotein 1ab [Kineococcus sp. NPDC059986]|uniref:tetratricopeptide repeat protein n=1 Tax=Kineococcus sp. NPDC059986 TaxID=3155538 RepID=UPI00344C6A9B
MTGKELAPDVRRALQSLPSESVDVVAKHLVASGQLVDVDPEAAWQHALVAQKRGGRIAAVREAAGIAAYKAGHFREALAELRTVRRMTGDDGYLPLMADCERGLGRPERALDLATSPEVAGLETPAKVEMLIVAAGARHDLGQHDAAVVSLQVPQLRTNSRAPWRARLWYAYADALISVGRTPEAREWLVKAAEADADGETDAAERLDEIDGIVFDEVWDDEDSDDAEESVDAVDSATGPDEHSDDEEDDEASDEDDSHEDSDDVSDEDSEDDGHFDEDSEDDGDSDEDGGDDATDGR